MSTGIRNNNYLNVKNGASPWLDANGKSSKTDSRGHAVFTDPSYGVRAGIILLRVYFNTHNLRTIGQILARWAPATDTVGSLPDGPPNSPLEYSQFVSGQMKIGYNATLELFDAEGHIGDLGQLKGLFYAMARYEIGPVDGKPFKVPDKIFLAGVELLEPGIKLAGTESTDIAVVMAGTATLEPKIRGSVGDWAKGATNAKADVETVQNLLRSAAMLLKNPQIDPEGLDGKIAKRASRSPTVMAICAFQSRYFVKPDGLIEPNGRTWRELLGVVNGGPQTSSDKVEVVGSGKEFFPFAELPSVGWTGSPRGFASNRSNGRAHAGCDLYFPKGTTIHAIADGTVVRGPEPFYAGTFALEVDHGSFTARYGEIQGEASVSRGARVVAGQAIAKVGHLVGITVPSDMLHLELYDNSRHGPLTVPASEGKVATNGRPFMRRKDLIDPTARLNVWKNCLPGSQQGPPTEVKLSLTVPAMGYCISLRRIRQETRAGKTFARTVGEFECYWNGKKTGLSGQMVERGGPGNNTYRIGNLGDRRIRQGAYRLSIHDGSNYKTYGYDPDDTVDGRPKPGLLLEGTGERTAILIHPGNDYVSSVGCLNPTSGLSNAVSKIDFADSRTRAIAIIEDLKAKFGGKFPRSGRIQDAVILIEGEPV